MGTAAHARIDEEGPPTVTATPPTPSHDESRALRRVLGPWDLTAIGINQVIGGAVFLVPAQVVFYLGGWSPLGLVVVGLSSLFVAACYAEVGSRFDTTGGAYIYTRAAFGRFIGFEVGWMQWFTRAASLASVVNGIALAVGYYWPGAVAGPARATIIVSLTTVLTLVNIAGIRQSAWLVNLFTIAKLVPLVGFAVLAAGFFEPQHYPAFTAVPVGDASAAALLLVFTFGGFDVVGVPAGEARDPRRDVPFAFIVTVAAVTMILVAIQVVLMGTLPGLSGSTTPLADAAARLAGPMAALVMGLAAVLSMTGNSAGQILSGSRMLFALAERGELPSVLARIRPVVRTPVHAILFTSVVGLALALSGSFAKLAAVSAVARLIAYAGTAAATLALRRRDSTGTVPPASFTIPFGAIVPVLALGSSLIILVGASNEQLASGAVALIVGAVLFLIASISRGRAAAVHRGTPP